jgi:hypothetical protein
MCLVQSLENEFYLGALGSFDHVFTHKYYWTSYMSYNSLYIQWNSLQFSCNLVTTIPFQLLCNSPMNIIIMSCWHHFSSIHQILTHDIIKIFWWFFWNIDIHSPLWLFILYGLRLWHVAQSKVAMWYNKYI